MANLKLKEKIGYSFGDAASSMFWKLFGMYIMFFYTDIFGISAAIVGSMFLITRIGDAVIDPMIGIIADRTQTRWGKFRPYLLWVALPFGIIGVLTFTTPSLSMSGKIIYAYVTYSLMMIIYSFINVPYASLLGVMTSDGKERTTLATYRFIGAFAGSFLVFFLFQPLFDGFGTKTINRYQAVTDSIYNGRASAVGNHTQIWTTNLHNADYNEITDSLVFVTADISTKSKEAFNVGILNTGTNTTRFITFRKNIDTLGLIRDGSFCPIRINISNLLGKWSLKDIESLKMVCIYPEGTKINFNNVNLKEINYPKGTMYAVIVIAFVAVFLFLLTFSWTKERIQPVKIKSALRTDLKDLMKNGPWFILLGASIFTIFFNTLRDGAAIYYFKYYFKVQANVNVFNIIFNYSTIYFLIGQAANIIGVILAKPVSDRIGKKNTFFGATIVATVLSLLFYLPGGECLWIVLVLQFLISISAGAIFPLIWSMFADSSDYSEWRNKRRATGLVFSAASMSQKFGASVGIALVGYILALYGYKANVEQAQLTKTGIRMMLSIYPAIGSIMATVLIFMYPLKDSYLKRIEDKLSIQRSK